MKTRRINAGEIRGMVTTRYGAVLTFGGSYDMWSRGIRWTRTLARITGIPQSVILLTICADYREMLG